MARQMILERAKGKAPGVTQLMSVSGCQECNMGAFDLGSLPKWMLYLAFGFGAWYIYSKVK